MKSLHPLFDHVRLSAGVALIAKMADKKDRIIPN
jgi:hypothetical protein